MNHPASAAPRPKFANAPHRQEAPPHRCHTGETDCILHVEIGHVFRWKHVPPGQGNFKNDLPPLGIDRYDSKFTVKTINHPSQVMVWGFSTRKGVMGESFLLMWPWGGVIMWMFWGIICSHSLTCIAAVFFFMHDGAPAHRTITVREFLASHTIPVLDWPGNSPDLNPIENAWQIMKNRIHAQAPTSVKELQELLKRTWVEMDPA